MQASVLRHPFVKPELLAIFIFQAIGGGGGGGEVGHPARREGGREGRVSSGGEERKGDAHPPSGASGTGDSGREAWGRGGGRGGKDGEGQRKQEGRGGRGRRLVVPTRVGLGAVPLLCLNLCGEYIKRTPFDCQTETSQLVP